MSQSTTKHIGINSNSKIAISEDEIVQHENYIKKKNIFPDSVSKSSLVKAWGFAKASVVEVELIIHLDV